MTAYLEQGILNHISGGAALSQPAQWWAGLRLAGGEVSGGGYARVQIYGSGTASSPRWTAPAVYGGGGYYITNAQTISFPSATADWGEILQVVIFDASSGGNEIIRRDVEDPRTILNGDRYDIAAGDLVVPCYQPASG